MPPQDEKGEVNLEIEDLSRIMELNRKAQKFLLLQDISVRVSTFSFVIAFLWSILYLLFTGNNLSVSG